jgi:hypothetical protein
MLKIVQSLSSIWKSITISVADRTSSLTVSWMTSPPQWRRLRDDNRSCQKCGRGQIIHTIIIWLKQNPTLLYGLQHIVSCVSHCRLSHSIGHCWIILEIDVNCWHVCWRSADINLARTACYSASQPLEMMFVCFVNTQPSCDTFLVNKHL